VRGLVVAGVVAWAGVAGGQEPTQIGEILENASGKAEAVVVDSTGSLVRILVRTGAGRESEYLEQKVIEVNIPRTYLPRLGGRFLRFCSANVCPQWVAFERRNFFVFRSIHADEEVTPGVMELGTKLSDNLSPICVRARVVWLGQPNRFGRIEGTFDPLTGSGIAWGGPLGQPRGARMSVGAGLGPWPDEALSITVKAVGTVRFVGGPIERHRDGCYEADLMPVAPLARTPAELAAALRGDPAKRVLGRGSISVEGRSGTFTVTVEKDGRILVDGPADFAYTSAEVDPDSFDVRLKSKKFIYDLDGLSAPLPGAGIPAALVVARRMKRELSGTVYRAADQVAVGRFTLR
jgi:hypothetical protein